MLKPSELVRQMAEECVEDLLKGQNRVTVDRIELWMHRVLCSVEKTIFDAEDMKKNDFE